MTNNLKEYLLKNTFYTRDLKDLIKINILYKPKYYKTSKVSIHNLLELSQFGLNKGLTLSNENLIKNESIIPDKLENLTKIIGYRVNRLYQLKTNHSRFTLKYKKTINIYWLEVIGSYRGWRHIQGLPVHGQRTWTNAWSVYKSNLDLREFVVSLTKKVYKTASNITNKALNLAYLAEHVNRLWSVQWELEWKKARKKRINALKKDYKNYTVDLVRLASGNVNSKKVRKNRKKQAEEKKNIFYLGFDKGFTKYLLENNSLEEDLNKKKKQKKKTKKNENLKLNIILSQEVKSKAKKKNTSKKKKAELQAKKRKNILLKKKKKSVWD